MIDSSTEVRKAMAKQARAVITREAIVAAAGRVFSRSSYASATMADVIKEAGVTQGALYFHFSSKKDLAEEVIKRQHEISIATGEQHLRSAVSGLEGLVLLSAELARHILEDPVVRAGLRLSTESIEFFPDIISSPYRDWITSAEMFLRRGVAERDIRADLDIEATSFVIMAAFTGVQIVAQATEDLLVPRIEQMWRVLFRSLVASGKEEHAERAIELLQAGNTTTRPA